MIQHISELVVQVLEQAHAVSLRERALSGPQVQVEVLRGPTDAEFHANALAFIQAASKRKAASRTPPDKPRARKAVSGR